DVLDGGLLEGRGLLDPAATVLRPRLETAPARGFREQHRGHRGRRTAVEHVYLHGGTVLGGLLDDGSGVVQQLGVAGLARVDDDDLPALDAIEDADTLLRNRADLVDTATADEGERKHGDARHHPTVPDRVVHVLPL